MQTKAEYDPFSRGPFAVGVRTFSLTDASRDRTLPLELWYPATAAHAGEDLDPERQDEYQAFAAAPATKQAAVRDAEGRPGELPLILFSHGYGGERRQTTHFCTHLASHGYAVASMDHIGNTMADTFEAAQSGGAVPDPADAIAKFVAARPLDAIFVLDSILDGALPFTIDAQRIGMTGHSFGGWTTLETAARDARIRATLPLAPAGGGGAMDDETAPNPLKDDLSLDWDRPVPTLFLVADLDTILPLPGMRDLIERTPAPCRAVALENSDHFHFCDAVEQAHDMFKTMAPLMIQAQADPEKAMAAFSAMKSSGELCPGEHAYTMIQGLGLAHFDAYVRDVAAAADFLSPDLASILAARGIASQTLR
jgi:dienelactone hydrolase